MKAWSIPIVLLVVTATTVRAERPFFRIVDGPVVTGQPSDNIQNEMTWLDANTLLVRLEITSADTHVDPASVDYRVTDDTIRVCYKTINNRPTQYDQEPFRYRYLEIAVPHVSKKRAWTVSFRGTCDER